MSPSRLKSNLIRSQKVEFSSAKKIQNRRAFSGDQRTVWDANRTNKWSQSLSNHPNDSGGFVLVGKVVRNSTNGLHAAENEPGQTTDENVVICSP